MLTSLLSLAKNPLTYILLLLLLLVAGYGFYKVKSIEKENITLQYELEKEKDKLDKLHNAIMSIQQANQYTAQIEQEIANIEDKWNDPTLTYEGKVDLLSNFGKRLQARPKVAMPNIEELLK